jgi:glycosyltransferase involved in cell wall biosynthesis
VGGNVVQVIQRLIPGGIETLALDLSARLPGDNRVLSLEWSRAQIIGNWPALADSPVPFEGLEKPPGIRPGFVFTLARRLRELKPRGVLAHHVGPLLYGGLAARLAGVPRFVYVEHDVWHYQNANHRRLAGLAARLVRPHIVAVSHNVAQTVREGICPDTGCVVPPEDPQAMAEAITRMLARPPGGDPRAFVLSHYSWARMVAGYEALLGANP